MKFYILTFLVCLFTNSAFSELPFKYNELTTKDLEEMNNLIKERIQFKGEDADKNYKLKEALLITFSRPDTDGVIDKIFPQVKFKLQDEDLYEETLRISVKDAIEALKNEATDPKSQVTYAIFLENIMAELKPQLSKDTFIQELYSLIRDAEIKITSKAKLERKLTSMKTATSPSKIAEKLWPKKK